MDIFEMRQKTRALRDHIRKINLIIKRTCTLGESITVSSTHTEGMETTIESGWANSEIAMTLKKYSDEMNSELFEMEDELRDMEKEQKE